MENLLILSELTNSNIGGIIFWLVFTAFLGVSNFFLREENKELKDKLHKMTSNPPIKDKPSPRLDTKSIPYDMYQKVVDENRMLTDQIRQHIENF